MKFEKKVDGGVVYVCLNPEGLQLPVLPFDPKPFLEFKIGSTYKTLAAGRSQEEWDIVFGYPEKFLNSEFLTDEDRGKILSTMVYMHYLIRSKLNADNIVLDSKSANVQYRSKAEMLNLQNELSRVMCTLNDSVSFLKKLRVFAADSRYVPQPECDPNLGTRPQDSQEKTLYPAEQITLTSLAIMAKLFSPISSVFISCCKDIKLDSMFNEIHCNVMYRNMLDETYPDLMDKLDGIIRSIVEKKLKDISETDLYNGNTVSVLTAKNIAGMLTRKLVVVNLDQKGTNLATYIHACVQSTTNSSSGNKYKLSVKSRKRPNDAASLINGDGNESVLETESISSARTDDFTDIISFAVDTTVTRYFCDKNISNFARDSFYAAVSYYDTQGHMVIDPVNSYILGIMFGTELMGGRSVELLKSTDLSRLIALAQVKLINEGYSHELVALISAKSTGSPKLTNTGAEVGLVNGGGWRSSTVYNNLSNQFRFSCNGITWDTGLFNLVNAVTHTVYLINIAPSIIEYMADENLPENITGEEFSASSALAEDVCILIRNYTLEETQLNGV